MMDFAANLNVRGQQLLMALDAIVERCWNDTRAHKANRKQFGEAGGKMISNSDSLCIYMPAIDRSLSDCCLLCIYMPAIYRSLSDCSLLCIYMPAIYRSLSDCRCCGVHPSARGCPAAVSCTILIYQSLACISLLNDDDAAGARHRRCTCDA